MTAKYIVHNTLKNTPKHRHHLESNKENEASFIQGVFEMYKLRKSISIGVFFPVISLPLK